VQVDFSEEGDRLVARPVGRMDADDGDAFAAAVAQKLTPASCAVSVDLSTLDTISLGGVRAILKLARSLKSADRNLDFLNGGDGVRHALEQAGMADFFAFTPAFHSNRGHHHEAS
jgi:anti-anti-sigma regulatory factor